VAGELAARFPNGEAEAADLATVFEWSLGAGEGAAGQTDRERKVCQVQIHREVSN